MMILAWRINPAQTQDASQKYFAPPHLEIAKTLVGRSAAAGKYRMVTFDLQWENSWRTSGAPDNWDAAWVFIKYKVGGGEWKHATLSAVAAEHKSPSGATLTPAADGKGVFIYRSENGAGAFRAPGVSVRWNCGIDQVADGADVSMKIFGLEMVSVPEGAFYAGDNGASPASLIKGSNDKRPWLIESEKAIEVTNTASGGFYYRSSKDFWSDRFNASEDVTGTSFTIPAEFPKGYRAVYCMKYEMSQRQYADFLNTLNPNQASNRYDKANVNKYGYTILDRNGEYSTAHPDRACGFITPADGCAYADWSGLRPMTELEFEKICRGSGRPAVSGEFAWGTTKSKNAVSVNGTESDREAIAKSGANSYYSEPNFRPLFPLNIGIFAGPGKSREHSGASFYGVMEMGSNLQETCVSIGNRYGRAFTFRNSDGRLAADGFADEDGWPLRDGKGAGYRGGTFAREQYSMLVSNRVEAATEIDKSHRHIPWGFRGVRTI